ncbi:hypothetical protein G6F57_011350 [Rhizopus arrhizus]|uniref:Methyltransferase domain-containing protein n=1 Tax=Rhizopus oryzae TaxID=64495 RepID=A0A9P6X002_RHIOR|nr:hypothetical protein G6F24_011169 [Rhizopus arrhizus]KAG1407470.1 hypothetical protein G6F58_009654 [Rhizopus delemar]KAG0816703.1 hypothetical protein G6F20_002979 [Rhizopus arrhizus]KAG0826077.1 hypothetical protein G6F19_009469 [Rhizopus arrhizus]KAG0848762.1 hypothetical protein G6F17_011367 [Rhizopus arrhizus]
MINKLYLKTALKNEEPESSEKHTIETDNDSSKNTNNDNSEYRVLICFDFCTYHISHKVPYEFGATESGSKNEGVYGTKTMVEGYIKSPRILKDMLDNLLDQNHFALKALFEKNTLPVINENIDFELSTTRVLDIGCGPGSWVMDMATEYSHTQFVGIDKLPLFPQDIRPANVTFKEADVLAGLPFEDNSFDLIQMRLFLVTFNRTQYIESLNEIHRLLKPGGFIQLVEPQLMDQGDDFIKEYTSKLKIIMEYNDYDSEVSDHLSILLDKTRFITKEILRKGVPLESHPLSKEFQYIVQSSVVSCKPFLMELHGLQTDEEFDEMKTRYMESRKKTESVFTMAVGQKPF